MMKMIALMITLMIITLTTMKITAIMIISKRRRRMQVEGMIMIML